MTSYILSRKSVTGMPKTQWLRRHNFVKSKFECNFLEINTFNTYYSKRLNKKRVWLKSQIVMIYHRIHQSYHGDHKNKSISNFQLFVYIL